MNEENIKKWVTALRSGKFIQTKGVLKERKPHKKTRHCCLGVACEVLGIKSHKGYDPGFVYTYDGFGGQLPRSAMELLGVSESDPHIDFPREVSDRKGFTMNLTLTSMNDKYNFTFDQIADTIEYFGLR